MAKVFKNKTPIKNVSKKDISKFVIINFNSYGELKKNLEIKAKGKVFLKDLYENVGYSPTGEKVLVQVWSFSSNPKTKGPSISESFMEYFRYYL